MTRYDELMATLKNLKAYEDAYRYNAKEMELLS